MKKIIVILALFTLFCTNQKAPVYSQEIINPQLTDVSETNDSYETETLVPDNLAAEEAAFAPIDLDLSDYSHLNQSSKKFNIRIEKEEKPAIVKSTGRIWDESKLFRYNYYSDTTNLRVLPSYGTLGAYVTTNLDANTKVMVGQDGLSSIDGDTLNFFYTNGSYYSNGASIEGKMEHFNYVAGAFTNTDSNNNDLAAAISSKPQHLLNSKGTFSFGGGLYSNILSNDTKNTAGVFSQYRLGKFSMGAQFSQSTYSSGNSSQKNLIHIIPKYTFNDHLAMKSKLVKDLDEDELQGELTLQYKPFKNPDSVQFNITATNYQSQNTITRQRLKFTTEFKI